MISQDSSTFAEKMQHLSFFVREALSEDALECGLGRRRCAPSDSWRSGIIVVHSMKYRFAMNISLLPVQDTNTVRELSCPPGSVWHGVLNQRRNYYHC